MFELQTKRAIALAFAFGLIAAACGGGGGSASSSQPAATPGPSAATGSTKVGTPTLDADPGQAWVQVDGERLDYEAAGSIYYECTIDDDKIIVNFQTPGGHDLSLTGSTISNTLNVRTTFTDGGGSNITYGGTLTRTPGGKLGIGDSQLSYEGPVSRTNRSDPTNPRQVDAKIAVNCTSSGDDPTVTVDGESFSVPIAGAQSVTCDVAPGDIDIMINRLATDDLQIQISVRTESSGLLGAVSLVTADGSYIGTIPLDGEGLVIDDNTVTFDGTFTTPDGADVDGTAEVTCP